ncbi:MAG TPA: hypothetical protein PKY87_08020, partial [Terricaulis sp.]|nr:hypothetical protein [Terricaulis sp.]
ERQRASVGACMAAQSQRQNAPVWRKPRREIPEKPAMSGPAMDQQEGSARALIGVGDGSPIPEHMNRHARRFPPAHACGPIFLVLRPPLAET